MSNLKISIIVLLLSLSVACSALRACNSVASAPGRVVTRTMQTDNIINNYEWFYDSYHQIRSRINQIKQHKSFLKGDNSKDEKVNLRIELAGMQQSCRDLVEKYNSNSSKVNRDIFKSKSLPHTLDIQICE